jgi:hypothetical protein
MGRDELLDLRAHAHEAYVRMKGGHGVCPGGELWLVLAYVIERLLASGLC